MRHLIRNAIVLVVVLGLVGLGAAWYWKRDKEQAVSFRTAPIRRGDLLATIKATGTVEPEEVVDVGAQVAGQINTFGKDERGKSIDYGSEVEEGTVLAQIDDSLYVSDVSQAQAQLLQVKASYQSALANAEQLKAKLDQAERDWTRAQKMGPSEALAQSSYDAYRSAYQMATANVEVGKAAADQAKAAITQAEASLQRAQRNLGYCTIKAPVKGVIIDRRVNIGQTVVSSLSAPSLFLIAKDLKRMQVWVSVNEADIGNIHPGQPATFTVDAFPGEVFPGEVGQVRLNATMTQNVVTYTVEVTTDNSSGKLLPYLTANVQFELSRRKNVLLAPNAALGWSPQPGMVAPEGRSAIPPPKPRGGKPSRGDAAAENPTAETPQQQGNEGVLWAVEGRYVRPVPVRVGPSNGTLTEVDGDGLKEGLEVALGEQQQTAASTGTTNPFTPQLGRARAPANR